MKYILNEIPIKTTNNFNINNLKIDLNLPTNLEFKKFKSNIDIKYNIIDDFNSKIGLKFSKALNLDIIIDKIYNEDIELIYEFNDNETLIDNINIDFKENSKSNIIIKYISKDNGNHFHHLKINTNSINSNNTITIINLLNNNSTNIIASENILNNSILTNNLIDIGSKIKINNYYSLTNKTSESLLNNIYIGINEDIVDMNYNYINNDINSINNIESQGILDNNSNKKFRGTINFIKGSSKSKGNINENSIILSDDVISSSVPIILCGEEDVIGTHSVSSGKIDDDKLFYLMSRGLTKDEAKKLIILSNFNKIIDKFNDKIKEEIIENINKVIN